MVIPFQEGIMSLLEEEKLQKGHMNLSALHDATAL